MAPDGKLSDRIERWLRDDQPKTLGNLVEMFGEGSFAIVFVLLMAVPALPLPTGGATHVLELVTMLLALELIAGRRRVWLPQRWKRLQLAGASQQRFVTQAARPSFAGSSGSRALAGDSCSTGRLSGVVFGLAVLALTLSAFLAPPFSGLDTLPSIGVVLLALGVLMRDIALALAGVLVGALGDRRRRRSRQHRRQRRETPLLDWPGFAESAPFREIGPASLARPGFADGCQQGIHDVGVELAASVARQLGKGRLHRHGFAV